MVTEPKVILGNRMTDFEEWGLDPALAGGYAVITHAGPKVPFLAGEILVLDGEFGREIEDPQRKPSKWTDVACEWFGQDLGAAERRSDVILGS